MVIILYNNLPIRGGITYGDFYRGENIVVENTLIEAYNMGSKLADYPRIVADTTFLYPNKAEEITKN